MRSKLSIVLSALLILGLLVTACGTAATPAPAAEQPAAPAASAGTTHSTRTARPPRPSKGSSTLSRRVARSFVAFTPACRLRLPGFRRARARVSTLTCQAVAAAVFGDPNAAEFVPISAAEPRPCFASARGRYGAAQHDADLQLARSSGAISSPRDVL